MSVPSPSSPKASQNFPFPPPCPQSSPRRRVVSGRLERGPGSSCFVCLGGEFLLVGTNGSLLVRPIPPQMDHATTGPAGRKRVCFRVKGAALFIKLSHPEPRPGGSPAPSSRKNSIGGHHFPVLPDEWRETAGGNRRKSKTRRSRAGFDGLKRAGVESPLRQASACCRRCSARGDWAFQPRLRCVAPMALGSPQRSPIDPPPRQASACCRRCLACGLRCRRRGDATRA
jgi:hypothetical protein